MQPSVSPSSHRFRIENGNTAVIQREIRASLSPQALPTTRLAESSAPVRTTGRIGGRTTPQGVALT